MIRAGLKNPPKNSEIARFLGVIKRFQKKEINPARRELADKMGWSLGKTHYFILTLVKMGYLKNPRKKHRSLVIVEPKRNGAK